MADALDQDAARRTRDGAAYYNADERFARRHAARLIRDGATLAAVAKAIQPFDVRLADTLTEDAT